VDVVGDKIVRILHSRGIEYEGAVVDTYAILLASGCCIELTEGGPAPASAEGLEPDPIFDRYVGLRIVAVESAEEWPTCGIRLSNGCALVMGSPHPYYWGLQEADP
jgi:hypothetical protein